MGRMRGSGIEQTTPEHDMEKICDLLAEDPEK